MLKWNEQSIKNCKSDCIVAISDGVETYYADAEGLSAPQAKADFISQCDPETDWSDAEVYFLPDYDVEAMREENNTRGNH
ncbi:unnamed protein product [Sphagnum tenellum]